MNITKLTANPQLVKIVLDDENIIKKYNEPIEFYTWDRYPMAIFAQLATIDGKNKTEMIGIVKDLILDENGVVVINDTNVLPTDIMLSAFNKVTELLGK